MIMRVDHVGNPFGEGPDDTLARGAQLNGIRTEKFVIVRDDLNPVNQL